nr:MAG TPA: hypothetical protein [Caudoviricetes sp.]
MSLYTLGVYLSITCHALVYVHYTDGDTLRERC